MRYVEERVFTLRLEVRCEFPDDYEGEDDGYAWAPEIEPLAEEIVRSAVQLVGKRGWRVRPANRGRPSAEEITLVVERPPVDSTGNLRSH